jgi:hypothetical protein
MWLRTAGGCGASRCCLGNTRTIARARTHAGFFTGRKKESMFKVPEGGKVGVIGSGKGVTEYKKQKRHEFSVE